MSARLTPRRRIRCPWAGTDPLMIAYHDAEWGIPVHNDRRLFEFLILEGAQAGLSWRTILHRREGYRKAFAAFDPKKVALFRQPEVRRLLRNSGIIRNRAKVRSAVHNAQAFLSVQKEFGSFDRYIWQFVNGAPIDRRPRTVRGVPSVSPEAETLSRDFKNRGFTFVGPTICYAFLQAVGLVNDHLVSCSSRRRRRNRT